MSPLGHGRSFFLLDTGPCRVLLRISSNAFELDISLELGINPVFNVEDLTSYHAFVNYLAPSLIHYHSQQ